MSETKLPNKSLFKLDEVSPLVGVKPYVLRFWENQFPEISPIRSSSGQMLYREEDVQVILKIKDLLFEKKLSVEQAKLVMGGAEMSAVLEAAPKANKPKTTRVIKATKPQAEPAEEKNVQATSSVEVQSDAGDLSLAKRKLKEMISLAESLKKTHHWD